MSASPVIHGGGGVDGQQPHHLHQSGTGNYQTGAPPIPQPVATPANNPAGFQVLAAAATCQQQHHHQALAGASSVNINNNNANYSFSAKIASKMPKPIYLSSMSMSDGPNGDMTDPCSMAFRVGTGMAGADTMTRIAMALRSETTSEINWALHSLVQMSYQHVDGLRFDMFSGLAQALVYRISQSDVFQTTADQLPIAESTNEDDPVYRTDLLSPPSAVSLGYHENEEEREKLLEATLVLRNTALNPDNARSLAQIRGLKRLLTKGLTLSDSSTVVELKHYLLDVAEAVSIFISIDGSSDPLFIALCDLLLSEDRGVMVTALRTLARLVIKDQTNALKDIEQERLSRICRCLLLDPDEELLSTCLDLLYQYTIYKENVSTILASEDSIEFVHQLVRLLLYQAQEKVQTTQVSKRIPVKQPAPMHAPPLPESLMKQLAIFPEPDRATLWMRASFEEDLEADVTQIALWKAYESRFEEYVRQGRRLLPAADFIKNATVAFKHAAAMVVQTPQGQKFIIKGIKPRKIPLAPSGKPYKLCKWKIPDVPDCGYLAEDYKDLYRHILENHLPSSRNQNENDDNVMDFDTHPRYICRWKSCGKFGPEGEENWWKVAAHVRTHFEQEPVSQDSDSSTNRLIPIIPPASEDGSVNLPRPGPPLKSPTSRGVQRDAQKEKYEPGLTIITKQTAVDERGEAAGVSLTAALVLRNLARTPDGRSALMAVQGMIMGAAAFNSALGNYVADVLDLMSQEADRTT